MAGILRVPRTRGALSGVLLVLLGIWGGLIPMVGPYFNFAYGPDSAWHMTSGRLWLEVVPAAAVFLGGLIVLLSANRAVAAWGAWLAAIAGGWFVVGVALSALWASTGFTHLGAPIPGGSTIRALLQIALFTGLGAVIIFFAALALGRFAVVGVRERGMREPRGPEPTVPKARPSGEPEGRRVAGPSGTSAEEETRAHRHPGANA